ncbi:MAG: hypothetical protein AB8G26_05760 [Ilumatobacter sp.]
MDSTIGRATWRALEPLHSAIYFVPEAGEEYSRVGLTDWMSGYFASRAAPMGAVTAEVVIATFYNFDHDLVHRSMRGVWETASPETVTAARFAAVDRMFRMHVLDLVDPSELARAVALARRGAEAVSARPWGRPLFAGHAGLEWPDEPHLALWHAQTLLREFRGDGHVIALASAGLDGCQALVLHGASGEVPPKALRATRRRTEADWNGAADALRSRGWLDSDSELTDAGRIGRAEIEELTDQLAVEPYAAIGEEGCGELCRIARPWAEAIAGVFPTR